MKLIKADRGQFSFQIDEREKRLLFEALNLYPLIPASYQPLSKSGHSEEDQRLLEQALAAQRTENKKRLQGMMRAKSRFQASAHGYSFSLKATQMEWLLQVLNDVRVGSWLALGSPDGPAEIFAALNEKTAPYLWAMEVSGLFQTAFLRALEGGGDSGA